ncbi:MAG TPA: beta-ketoacyl-[acyl-carrier-protein] synthase family protein [Gemmatimonadaceae bacterium]
MSRVVITGMGVVTPVGRTVCAFFDALVAARSGVRRVPAALDPDEQRLVAAMADFDATAHWRPHQASRLDRGTQLAIVAARDATMDAGLALTDEEAERAGVYWGTGFGGATSIEESYRKLFSADGRVRPTAVVLGMSNAAAAHVSIDLGLRGPILNVATACSSSASAIGEAFRTIRAGDAEVVVAGGSEALVTLGNLRAWDAMQALAHADPCDPSRSCKPFSANRTGVVLGEGAAALVLERESRARRRGATIYGEVLGYGNAGDARGMSQPDPGGQARAMRAALRDACIAAGDVDYLNAHGTGTLVGDEAETVAIRQAFGAAAQGVAISSTKALHGHLMGATGATELVASICAMQSGVLPPTAHLECADPACDLDYVPNVARDAALDVVMSSSFGFGGMNAVLVARRYNG